MIRPWFNLSSFLLFFALLWSLMSGVLYAVLQIEKAHQLDLAKEQQKYSIEKSFRVLNGAFKEAAKDVVYLTELKALEDYVNNPASPELKQNLSLSLTVFVNHHLNYSQVRFIDFQGAEKVRINEKQGRGVSVSDTQLQYKGESPYVTETRKLLKGQVYISGFDFNREFGVIEQPYHRVIRFASPVFNRAQQKVGMMVINVNGDDLYQKMQRIADVKGVSTQLLHSYQNHDYVSLDHKVSLINDLPALAKAFSQMGNVWNSVLDKGVLYTYYGFDSYKLPEDPFSEETLTTPPSQYPWLFIVSIPEEKIPQNLLFDRFDFHVFWGLATLFIFSLSLLFSYLRTSKTHFKAMSEKQKVLLDGFSNNTPNAHFITDLHDTIIYANQVARELLGQGNEIVGFTLFELDLPEARRFAQIARTLIDDGQTQEFEVLLDSQWLHATSFPIINAKQEQVSVGCILSNQSQSLKKSEENLREKIRLLEAISQTQNQFMNYERSKDESFELLLSNFVALTDSELGFIGEVCHDELDRPYIKTHAISKIAWSNGMAVSTLDDRMEFTNMDTLFGETIFAQKTVIANDVASDARARGIPEGHQSVTRFISLPVFYQQEMVGVVSLANRDTDYDEEIIRHISPLLDLYGQMIHLDRLSAEKDEMAKQLIKKEHWLSMVIDTAPDGILLINDKGQIVLANQNANHMFGYATDELIQQLLAILIPKEDLARHSIYQHHYMQGKEQAAMMKDRAVQGLKKNGELFPVEVRLSPLISDEENTYVICSVRDISERIALDKQLRQSQKMDAIGQLTGGIAHDFNNLLAIVQGNLDLARLTLEDKDCDGVMSAIENAQQASERGAVLIKRLLAFARKQSLTPSIICLENAINDVLPMLHQALGSQISLQTHFEPMLGMVKIDQNQFENALINLAVNAKDAMEDGGQFEIRVSNLDVAKSQQCVGGEKIPNGHYVLVEVSDNGHGVSQDQIEHIFEPFYTSKVTGKGTGLGLSMVYGFIRQSKGFIQVESQPELGTAFKLLFPALEASTRIEVAEESKPRLSTKAITILVVDDEPALLESSSRLIQRAGYKVFSAENAEQAMRILHAETVDLVFTDVVMPGKMNGIELVRQASRQFPGLKFVVGTGYSSELLEIPNNEWLNEILIFKPYREPELLHAIQKSLNNQVTIGGLA